MQPKASSKLKSAEAVSKENIFKSQYRSEGTLFDKYSEGNISNKKSQHLLMQQQLNHKNMKNNSANPALTPLVNPKIR